MFWIVLLQLNAISPALAAPAPTVRCEDVDSIGSATMDSEGVITLRIRSLPPGPIAESVLRYAPGHRDYEMIKAHLEGISPGQTKPVRPWC
jgi:hypothetical protein